MTDDGRIGQVLASKYRLDEELGRGGMGAVYRAFHLRVHKQFAVKVLTTEVAGKKSLAARLVLEAQAAGRIGHPGILEVYDVGEDDDGRPFLVMELLRGETLAALVSRGRLSPQTACWVASQVLAILDAAHRADVVHRDVKPQNVFLVAPSEEAEAGPRTLKLLDFGIAKFRIADATAITGAGEVIGSPLYMAPEQARGEDDVDARVDVWSVGAMLFEMLTGKPAHLGPSITAVLSSILSEPAPAPSTRAPSIPPVVDEVVRRALAIDRAERYPTARAMLDALEEARESCGWDGSSPSFPPASRRGARKKDGRVGSASREPAMDSAVTAGKATTTSPRSRTAGIVVAGLMLTAGAVLPWVVLRGGGAGEGTSARSAVPAPPPAQGASAKTEADAIAAASATAVTRTQASEVRADAPDAAALVKPVVAVSARAAVVDSKPSCAPGEVLSQGHCCPAGHVWQSGRCERPLATSF